MHRNGDLPILSYFEYGDDLSGFFAYKSVGPSSS